jgi:transcriptional regulator with XRE-family HTH domain
MATKDPGEWLNSELNNRDWSQSKLAREAGIDSGYVNRIISGDRKAGIEACIGIAKAFDMSIDRVVRALRPSEFPARTEESINLVEANQLFSQLTEDEQKMLLTQMRALVKKHDTRSLAPT